MTSNHVQYLPVNPILFTILLSVAAALFLLVQFGILNYAYRRLGLSPNSAFMLLLASLVGSYVNIPLAQLPSEHLEAQHAVDLFGMRYSLPIEVDWPGTVVAVNVGGAVVPLFLSLYLLVHNRIWIKGLIGAAIVTAAVHAMARPVSGVGVTVPMFVPPIVTAIVAVVLSRDHAAPVAYVSGSLGTLIGADIMNLGAINGLGAPIASIGGAGTFDGVFVVGVVAVLLAGLRRSRPRTTASSPWT
ncbi:DUF1614 domain-containing protein [Methylocystis bryophila]|uniref:DUF1614 domain-containing protein n=1 Tax=Methylocystis bryophila TaxID=655015 RepID=A0A1W6MZR2_9HYPH|nr:DUF1614 domain-containing protein [Methylocystis bryophila]ARN83070.1 hypothetical protein B1812_20505 [Methylocystis bryophila]BDV39382.1 membrane protein [Methylocystis bryophila]